MIKLIDKLIEDFEEEKQCEYRGELYSVRDNGAIMRHPKNIKKPRQLDNKWTFGKINIQKGYPMISSEPVHRIVATAFLGEAPTKGHVVDHIDTNRQNNRPSNLRWVTRLENIILNDITRKKLELLCGCSIDEILNDLSILRDKPLTPQFDWMRAVSKEEAIKSLETWKKWVNEDKERKEKDAFATKAFNSNTKDKAIKLSYHTNKRNNNMNYLLEPINKNESLEEYFDKLAINVVFCCNEYYGEKVEYKILDYYLNKEENILYVATINEGGLKPYYLTNITLKEDFCYDTQSFFSPDSLEKYMTIAKGEEWTGGDVFDDFC